MSHDRWNPEFHKLSPIFDPIKPFSGDFSSLNQWPGLTQFNQLFKKNNLKIRAVKQSERPEKFEDHYESRIYLKGELQTRTENWHDLFNAMAWLRFPCIKHSLNKLHYTLSQTREIGSNRSPIENTITLFDECGLIIISDKKDLLDLIRNHQWKSLFLDHKNNFNKDIRCITFGHAMYEKALNPYIGMTAHAILIESDTLLNSDLKEIDKSVANMWTTQQIKNTRDLQPVPILGIPGWYQNKQDEAFYDNTEYFRPKRK